MSMKKLLEHCQRMCYIINIKTTAHKGLTSIKDSIATLNRSKYKGGFCYVRLLTKRKNERKQCQKE